MIGAVREVATPRDSRPPPRRSGPMTAPLRVGLAGPRLDGPQPPAPPLDARGLRPRRRRRSRIRRLLADAVAKTGAAGVRGRRSAMIGEAEHRRGGHRRADDGARRRSRWPRSSAACRCSSRSRSPRRVAEGIELVAAARSARRAAPGRPRRAVQPGRARARPPARRAGGSGRSTRSPAGAPARSRPASATSA